MAQGICGVAIYKREGAGAGAGAKGPFLVYIDTHFPCEGSQLFFGVPYPYPVEFSPLCRYIHVRLCV